LIPEKRLLANVDGVMNAIVVKGDAVGPTLYYGAGAGAEPTGSSVVADIVDVARALTAKPEHRVPYLGFGADFITEQTILPIDDVETTYYMRMSAEDKPGVLSKIATILSDSGISIEAMIQKEAKEGESVVPLILLTNCVQEKRLIAAINKIESLDSIEAPVMRIRVESLK
jgi:homoserine dehydrogenase